MNSPDNPTLAAAASCATTVAGDPAAADAPVELSTDKQRVSYMIGMDLGRSLKPFVDEIDPAVLKRAIDDVLSGRDMQLTPAQAQEVARGFDQKMRARQQAEIEAGSSRNLAAEAVFLTENGSRAGVVTTASGLQYQALAAGSGAKPDARDVVRVHYAGTLLDGTTFDSSYDRGEPAEFGLGQVIPGWTEGLQLMSTGSKYRFWIPSRLGYGAQGTPGGPIGPHATLVFDVELLGIL